MDAILIFPPLVNSGFGQYYPALAVLSGALEANGLTVKQLDLNTLFAHALLSESSLEQKATGDFGLGVTVPIEEMACVAARLLKKNRQLLYDCCGRVRFGDVQESPAYLLGVLASPYIVDSPIQQLATLEREQQLAAWYRRFYGAQVDLSMELGGARVVGISVSMGPQILPALVLARCIRDLHPSTKIILGGAALSLMDEKDIECFLRQDWGVDAVVRFEGEGPLVALVEQCRRDDWNPARVSGVSTCQGCDVVHNPPVSAPGLNGRPFASYSTDILARIAEPELGIIQTRGCYWGRCAYCDFVELYKGSKSFRGRSPEDFVAEVQFQVKTHSIRRFTLITEAISPSFALRFSDLCVRESLNIRWNSFAMVDRHFTEEHFRRMAASGCDYLVIGMESMNDRTLSLVEKMASREDNVQFIRSASNAGIKLVVNLIPDLPTATREEAMEALRVIEAFEHRLWRVAVFPFEATRSSAIGRDPKRFGLDLLSGAPLRGQAYFASNHLEYVDPAMTQSERVQVQNAYREFADRVNGRERSCASVGASTTQLRLASENFDAIATASEAYLFNWRTRSRVRGEKGILSVLRHAADLPREFSRDELLHVLGGADTAEAITSALVDFGALEGVMRK